MKPCLHGAVRGACLPLILAALLSACGAGIPGALDKDSSAPPQQKPEVPVTEDRAGTYTDYTLVAKLDGADIAITVFEPAQLKKGERYPLIIYGHGWGGSRVKAPDFYTKALNELGFYVLTFDQRGFGQSGGTVRAMDPDYDGQNLVQILDWAEELPGLARFKDGRMRVGSLGGSYGGMYQFALAGSDPEHRLRVIAPDITPHDLDDSLNPRGVFKSAWGSGLIATMMPPLGNPDPVTLGMFTQGSYLNSIEASYRNYLYYHSVAYFCEGRAAPPQSFMIGTADTFLVPPGPLPKIDAFITQGFRDTMFNFNQGYDNYQCLSALGGDVRLATHQSGHILPVSISQVPGAEETLDPAFALINLPGTGDVGGNSQCGTVSPSTVIPAWFQEKLQDKKGAVDAVLPSGKDICLSLAQGDSVTVKQVTVGGAPFAVKIDTPQFNGYAGLVMSVAGESVREALLATLPLYQAPVGGAVLAGIPLMDLTLHPLAGDTPTCTGTGADCDPILFVGIGLRKAGQTRWDLVDDQVTPLRGFGAQKDRMVGVAERLAEGDELALLVYGFNAQFPFTASRDLTTPALTLDGSVSLPLLSPADIVHDGPFPSE